MKIQDQIKTISKIFNSSKNIEEFKVNLDLIGMTFEEAIEVYSEECHNIIEIMKYHWCDKSGKFSFKNVFKSKYLVLPCSFKEKIKKDSIQYQCDAIGPEGHLFRQSAKYLTSADILMIQSMLPAYKIDFIKEIVHTLLFELYQSMIIYR